MVPEEASLSRSRLMRLIAEGAVARDGEVMVNPKEKVLPGQVFTISIAPSVTADLVAEHARLAVGFSKFPVGGVAAVATESSEKSKAYVVTNMSAAQIHAVRGK